MSAAKHSSAAARTDRTFSFPPRKLFEAFEQADKFARWWGPKDFSNTFEKFEFKQGGRWVFAMHGPNGVNYANESVFREILTESRIVIEDISPPHFVLTVTLTARGDQTHLTWNQQFDDAEIAAKLRPIVVPANEQNLDRLQTLLASEDV